MHFVEECQTCPNISKTGILWPAMLTYAPLWLETSSLANSITVSAVRETLLSSARFGQLGHCGNNGEVWTEYATKCPKCLSKA